MFEVEAKLRVPDPGPVREALLAAGAACDGRFVEEDTFYTHPGRDFAATDEALRLRRVGERMELTYKGPRAAADGPAKAREERTVRVLDDPGPLLRCLGMTPRYRLRKTRELFDGPGFQATIDHLEGLGWFVEVEQTGQDAAAMFSAVAQAVRDLGLEGPAVPESYLELAIQASAPAVTLL